MPADPGAAPRDTVPAAPVATLIDLRRTEAVVRVTCKLCGHVTLHDREALIQYRRASGSGLEWPRVQAELICWGRRCRSNHVAVDSVPFSDDPVILRRRRAQTILINLALQVLSDAAGRSTKGKVGTPDVRLALRVLHPFVRDAELLQGYWHDATIEERLGGMSCHLAYVAIARRVLARGHTVYADLRAAFASTSEIRR
jgi:hypothetical protein